MTCSVWVLLMWLAVRQRASLAGRAGAAGAAAALSGGGTSLPCPCCSAGSRCAVAAAAGRAERAAAPDSRPGRPADCGALRAARATGRSRPAPGAALRERRPTESRRRPPHRPVPGEPTDTQTETAVCFLRTLYNFYIVYNYLYRHLNGLRSPTPVCPVKLIAF